MPRSCNLRMKKIFPLILAAKIDHLLSLSLLKRKAIYKLIIQNLIQKEVKQIKQKNLMTEPSKLLHKTSYRIRRQMPISWDSNYPKIDQRACLHRLRDSHW